MADYNHVCSPAFCLFLSSIITKTQVWLLALESQYLRQVMVEKEVCCIPEAGGQGRVCSRGQLPIANQWGKSF